MEGPEREVFVAGVQLTADGQHAPLAAGQQQPFQSGSLVQGSLQTAPYIEWFVQQRGYVAEMFRKEQEVVQRQLAEMQHQQLAFMQQQGHLMRDIMTALSVTGQNPEAHSNIHDERSGHEENIGCEVSFGECERRQTTKMEDGSVEANAHHGEGRRVVAMHHEPVRLQCQTSTNFSTQSTGTTLNTGCLCKANLNEEFLVNTKLAADGGSVFQRTEPVASLLYEFNRHQDDSSVNKPERTPDDGCKHLPIAPGAMESLCMSQQLISMLAGLKCTFGCLDDVNGMCREVSFQEMFAEQKIQAGRKVNMQVLIGFLKAFGSTPNHQVVGSAPPSEVKFERIRTNLEFEPPPSSTSVGRAVGQMMFSTFDRGCVNVFSIHKRSREPAVVWESVTFTALMQPHFIKPLSGADWDPGPNEPVADDVGYINADGRRSDAATEECGSTINVRCLVAVSDSVFFCIFFFHIKINPAVHIDKTWTCHRYRCHAALQVSEDARSGSTRTSYIKEGGCCDDWKGEGFHLSHDAGLELGGHDCQASTVFDSAY